MTIKECESIREESAQRELADVNQTYRGDHFTVHASIKSLCCVPETKIMLYVNYMSIFLKEWMIQGMYLSSDQWERAEFFGGLLGKTELALKREKKEDKGSD